MSSDKVKEILAKTQDYSASELLKYAVDSFGSRVAFSSSFSFEDQAILDMLMKISKDVEVFTLDTGRLPAETYDVIQQSREKYGIEIKMLFPDHELVEAMVAEYGPNLFYDSVEKRKMCCHIRKVEPLKRELSSLDAWICGLRAEQSVTRTTVRRVVWDASFELIKICPLADWASEKVWRYIRSYNVPYNKLHDKGYPSIGCAPCTRAIEPDEDIRAGRWWWEEPEHKECGLHLDVDEIKKEKGKK